MCLVQHHPPEVSSLEGCFVLYTVPIPMVSDPPAAVNNKEGMGCRGLEGEMGVRILRARGQTANSVLRQRHSTHLLCWDCVGVSTRVNERRRHTHSSGTLVIGYLSGYWAFHFNSMIAMSTLKQRRICQLGFFLDLLVLSREHLWANPPLHVASTYITAHAMSCGCLILW